MKIIREERKIKLKPETKWEEEQLKSISPTKSSISRFEYNEDAGVMLVIDLLDKDDSNI